MGDPKQQKQTDASSELTPRQKHLKAMSHNLRVRLLAYMNDRPWSPRELSLELDKGLSQVSYHVGVLRDFGLIELVKTKPVRGALEHFYQATARAFMPSDITKEFPKSARRSMIVDTLEDSNADIAASLASGRFDERDDYHVSYTRGLLDGQGCKDAEAIADNCVKEYLRVVSESAERRQKGEGDGACIPTSATVVVFGSERGKQEKASPRKPRRAAQKRAKKRSG